MSTISVEPTLTTGTWIIDPDHSEIGFNVRHLGMSRVRGRFNRFEGVVTISDDVNNNSVFGLIEMASVDTNNARRDGHLQAGDFFDVESHPQMTFQSTIVAPGALVGELTIKGTTVPIEFDMDFHGVTVDHYGDTRAGFSARGQIRRSDFGIDFNAPFGLDVLLVGDQINVELEVQLVPEQ